jgi:hypothetical protein
VLPSYGRAAEAVLVIDDGTVFGWIKDGNGTDQAVGRIVGRSLREDEKRVATLLACAELTSQVPLLRGALALRRK